MFNIDTTRTTDAILLDIQQSAMKASNDNNASIVFPPFAALLAKISREAAETADKNYRAQTRLIWLTVAILIVSLSLLALEVAKKF